MIGVFLDSEANGLNSHIHRLLEIAFQIVDLSNGHVREKFHAVIAQPAEVWEKSDKESLKITGFTWEEVVQGTPPAKVAEQIIACFKKHGIQRKKAVFICQNPSFDRIFFSLLIDVDTQELLNWPYHWLDLASMYWALTMEKAKQGKSPFPWETGFSKDLIASQYKLPQESKPHRAMNGVEHLLLCYRAVVGFPSKH